MKMTKKQRKRRLLIYILLLGIFSSAAAQQTESEYSGTPLVGLMKSGKQYLSADELRIALNNDPSDDDIIKLIVSHPGTFYRIIYLEGPC